MKYKTEDEIQQIQLHINNFIAYNEYEITKKRTWLPNNILYGDRNLGGFNMIKLEHFFQALKTSWINRYINGLDDHWADLIDMELNLTPNTRNRLPHIGADHPKILKIINSKLQGIPQIFKAYRNVNLAFHRHKEVKDNRWTHGPLFYNPSITREEGAKRTSRKKTLHLNHTLKPSDFGLPESICSEVKVHSLFHNNQIITKENFEQKFNCQINFLDYANLSRALNKATQNNQEKMNMNVEETPPHFKFKFNELFQPGSKGSQIYRKILKKDKPEIPIYNTEIWGKKLKTN